MSCTLVGWFQRFHNPSDSYIPFAYHRTGGYAGLLGAFGFVAVCETVGLHVIVGHWSTVAAWIIMGVSIYSLLWLVGDYHALRLHPILLDPDHLYLRTGLRWRATLDLAQIAELCVASKQDKRAQGYINMGVWGEPRLVLVLRQPVIVRGLFGLQKQALRIGLTVDDEGRFRAEVGKKLQVNG